MGQRMAHKRLQGEVMSAVCGQVWGTFPGRVPCFLVLGAGAAYSLLERQKPVPPNSSA